MLVNLISRRVRQLNSGGGGMGRPLVDVPAGMGMADIALREILEEKMGWEMPEESGGPPGAQKAQEALKRILKFAKAEDLSSGFFICRNSRKLRDMIYSWPTS